MPSNIPTDLLSGQSRRSRVPNGYAGQRQRTRREQYDRHRQSHGPLNQPQAPRESPNRRQVQPAPPPNRLPSAGVDRMIYIGPPPDNHGRLNIQRHMKYPTSSRYNTDLGPAKRRYEELRRRQTELSKRRNIVLYLLKDKQTVGSMTDSLVREANETDYQYRAKKHNHVMAQLIMIELADLDKKFNSDGTHQITRKDIPKFESFRLLMESNDECKLTDTVKGYIQRLIKHSDVVRKKLITDALLRLWGINPNFLTLPSDD